MHPQSDFGSGNKLELSSSSIFHSNKVQDGSEARHKRNRMWTAPRTISESNKVSKFIFVLIQILGHCLGWCRRLFVLPKPDFPITFANFTPFSSKQSKHELALQFNFHFWVNVRQTKRWKKLKREFSERKKIFGGKHIKSDNNLLIVGNNNRAWFIARTYSWKLNFSSSLVFVENSARMKKTLWRLARRESKVTRISMRLK